MMGDQYRDEIILYWREADQACIAEVPERPGGAADGATYQEALSNVHVMFQEWIETATALGRPIPEPKGRLMCASCRSEVAGSTGHIPGRTIRWSGGWQGATFGAPSSRAGRACVRLDPPRQPPNRRRRDPYVRWCGRGEAVRPLPIPIKRWVSVRVLHKRSRREVLLVYDKGQDTSQNSTEHPRGRAQ